MTTPKEHVKRLIEILPDDCTFEDVQYHIYVLREIEFGLKELDEGEGIPHDEVMKRMERWLSK